MTSLPHGAEGGDSDGVGWSEAFDKVQLISRRIPKERIAMITISAFKWVPEFAQGQVRDLRARWALEEAGLPYRTRLL